MQKEKSLALRAVEKRGGLCFAGAQTDQPCARRAVVPRPEIGETEIVLCEEHALAHRHALDAEDVFNALEMLHEWIQDGTPSDVTPGGAVLRGAAYHPPDELARRCFD